MSHEVLTALVITTGHVTAEEAKRLDREDLLFGLIVSMRSDEGWLVYLGTAADEADGDRLAFDEMSEGLRGAVQFARKHDLNYIRFDRDADALDGVAAYDW